MITEFRLLCKQHPIRCVLVVAWLAAATLGAQWGLASSALAAPPQEDSQRASVNSLLGRKVSEIKIEGNRRIEEEALRNKISTQADQPLTREKVRQDIRALFEMGYFDDIAVQASPAEGGQVAVTYVVRERPVISEIVFEGNERISTDDLKEVSQVKQWSILDVNQVKEDVARLQKHYEDKGFFLAKVDYALGRTADEEVKLVYKIRDFEKVKIKRITFLNNKHFSDETLKGILAESQEGGAFSGITGAGSFKETSFKQDLQRLTYWYLDNGYVKFRYENPTVTVSEDKKWLFVTIYVEEGEKYKVEGPVQFGGDMLFETEELRSLLTLRGGETFSISSRNRDIQTLTEKYQDKGYAFTNVIPKMNIKDDTKTIEMSYEFEKGDLVHFGEVRVLGNTKTHDKVIRRELKINEGQLYSGTALRLSRENVERLGFFSPGEVIFNTVTRKDQPDVLDLEVTVKERSTGTVTLGAGYGSVQGFFFTGQISENNLFGRGQTISLSAQLASSDIQKTFNLGFTDPYAFDTLWSAGFDLFYVNFPIPGKYQTRRTGFNLRGGYPLFDFTRGFVTYKFEGINVTTPNEDLFAPGETELSPSLADDIAADEGLLSSVIFSAVRDKRNNRFETTGGNYQSASMEVAGLGGEKRFFKYILNNRFYQRLIGSLVFRNSLEFGQIFRFPGQEIIPPSERFFLGGPNNLRGFDIFAVGPVVTRQNRQGTVIREPLGGSIEVFGLFELEYPLIREAGLKGVVFFDAGNVYNSFDEFTALTLRADAGFGFRWFSPIGPLRFEFGYPFNRRFDEDKMVFNFFIGTPF